MTGGRSWVRTAEATNCGVSRRQLYGHRYERATSGAYVLAGAGLAERAGAVLSELPTDTLVSHWTAAALMRLPLPYGRAGLPVHVLHPGSPWRATRRADLVGHTADRLVDHVVASGVRSTTPARTWRDLSRAGASVEELVVVGDAMLRRPLVAVAALEREVAQDCSRRGVRVARAALALLDGRAESPPESMLRLLVGGSGLPVPEPQLVVLDRSGRFVARVDLGWEEQRLAVEYDGRDHMTAGRWQHDLRRREALQSVGWRMLVVTWEQLVGDPDGVLRRIAAALAA